MPLTEAQIERYARHILLPEVGGLGQERLLTAGVRVRGESFAVELAGDYLSAAGVQVDAHSGAGLALMLEHGAVIVRAGPDSILVRSAACAECAGEPHGALSLEDGSIAATLAASEALLRILEVADGARAWEIRAGEVCSVPWVGRCEAHR